MDDVDDVENENVVLHIVVVEFHHKKGCQVEFSYPPMVDGDDLNSSALPDEWKYLPFLALPDGSHNFAEDSTYFHLPPRAHYKSQTTVYAVSCYRQISTELLKNKCSDVTRSSVQKSVVVLSQSPAYGLLLVKVQMITHAYFDEKDFSKKEILKDLYSHINLSVNKDQLSQKFFGLSARSLITTFHHKVLILFKLLLLEKKIVFYASPVHKLVGCIMALLSLYPGMIESGLSLCTEKNNLSVQEDHASQSSLTDSFVHRNENEFESISVPSSIDYASRLFVRDSEMNHSVSAQSISTDYTNHNGTGGISLSSLKHGENDLAFDKSANNVDFGNLWLTTSERASSIASSISNRIGSLSSAITSNFTQSESLDTSDWLSSEELEDQRDEEITQSFDNSRLEIQSHSPFKSTLVNAVEEVQREDDNKNIEEEKLSNDFSDDRLPCNSFGFPLQIFTRGHLCMPYVCLQQHSDLLASSERGYLIGTSNMLFVSQADLADAVVNVNGADLLFSDLSLKSALHLSAADLRFVDNLVNHVQMESDNSDTITDIFSNSTNWKGGDEWVQSQFSEYLTAMLSASLIDDETSSKHLQDFNEQFINLWKRTHNYQQWRVHNHKEMDNVQPLHPFHAQYTVNDVKLRIHHNLHGSESGRRVEDAMSNANNAVAQTGRVVGSAFVSAKSTVSSWLSYRRKKS